MKYESIIKSRLDELNLTQKQLADLSGIDASMISRYLSGTTIPVDKFVHLCNILGLEVIIKEKKL